MLDYLLQERMNRMNRMNKVASMTAANQALGGVLGASPKASILQRVLAKLSGLADDAGAVASRQERLANVLLHKGKKVGKAAITGAGRSIINASNNVKDAAVNASNNVKDAAINAGNTVKKSAIDAKTLTELSPEGAALLMGGSGIAGAGAGVGVDELIRALAAKKEQA